MDTTKVLQGTLFSWAYNLFGVSADLELMHRLTLSAIIYTIAVGFASLFIAAPYGRHSSGQARFSINATIAWIVSLYLERRMCCSIENIFFFNFRL